MRKRAVNGKKLNEIFGVTSEVARYRETGDWFGRIRAFPAVLWDGPPFGYIRFETEEMLRDCSSLRVHPSGQITAPKGIGIKFISGYVRPPEEEPAPKIEL